MRRSSKLVISIVAAAVASAGFAATAGAGETLTKAEFLKEGNAICKSTNADINAVFEVEFEGASEDDPPTTEQIQAVADGAVPILEDGIAQIDALVGPASLESKVDKVITLYKAAIVKVVADPASAFDEDGPEVFAKADKAAKKVGLKTCAQG